VKYLLDTNVYLDASRSAATRAQFRATFFPLLPVTYLSAVVAYELRDRAWRSKLPALLNDVLIALSARRIGLRLPRGGISLFRTRRKHGEQTFRPVGEEAQQV
jgi:predicted nucleic acid-binding protein